EVNFAALSFAQEVTHPNVSFLEQGALEWNGLPGRRIADVPFEQSGARRDAQRQSGGAVCRGPVVQTEEERVGHRLRHAASTQHQVSLSYVKRAGSGRRTFIARAGCCDFVSKTMWIVLGNPSALYPDQLSRQVTVLLVGKLQPTRNRAA